jgi:hypothetical protein
MHDAGILDNLIGRVRRRTITQLVIEQGAVALIAAFAGVIALLLAGTQVLAWYWPALLLGGAFLLGMLRIRERIPTRYWVAQELDQKLGFHDAVSTALYFSEGQPTYTPSAELVAAQRRVAEKLAAEANAEVAAPLRIPRQAYACLALVAMAGSLVVMRYGVRGSLDLRQPLVRMPFESLLQSPEQVAKAQVPPAKPKLPEGAQSIQVPDDGTSEQKGDRKKAEESFESQAVQTDDPEGKEGQISKEGQSSKEGGEQGGEEGEKGQGEQGGEQKGQQEQGAEGGGPQKNAKSPSNGANKDSASKNNSADNSSMMDKMRDAMQNMMSRLKMNPQAGENGKQNQASQKGAAQSASAQKQGQKGAPSPGKQGEGQAKSEEAGEQQGEGASKNQNAQGKMSDAAGEKQAAQEGKSGAGKQDGEKDIKDAQQAAAMGKISEILGKRAEKISGEIMVEVSSGRQQLKTQYEQKAAAHANTGGEINRDEVPAAYQQFVQQYFEEIRKTPGGAAPAPPATAAPKPGTP